MNLYGYTRKAPPAVAGSPVSFVAATSVEARDGMIVDVPSLKLEQYRSNPVVLYVHDSGGWGGEGVVIGRGEVKVEGSDLVADITFDEGKDNDLADLVARQVRDRFLNAVSISWRGGRRVRRSELPADHPYYNDSENWSNVAIYDGELLEISVVPVPADPRALARRSLDDSAELDNLYRTLRADLLAEVDRRISTAGPARTTEPPPVHPWSEWWRHTEE